MANLNKDTNAIQPYKSVISGTIAGIISKLIEYPFDTIKVIIQTRSSNNINHIDNKFNCKSFYNLYKGVHIPMLFSSLENATMFYSYSIGQKYCQQNENVYRNAMCGLFSGLCVSIILTPSELVKCKLQHGIISNSNNTIIKYTTEIYKKYGFVGFYQGHLSTMCREGLGTTVYFSTYEYFKYVLHKIHDTHVPIWKMAIAGSISGICYWTSIFPIDTIKSNAQIEKKPYKQIILNIYKSHGLHGFYCGYGVTVLRSVISNFFIFYSYEWGKLVF